MKKYSDYKDSGIDMIDDIPFHWQVVRLKFLLEEKLMYGANESAENENPEFPRYIRITDFDNNGNLRKDTFKSLPHEIASDYLLKEGDVLFARSGATVGKTFLFKNYNGNACFAGYLIKATSNRRKLLPSFLYYVTRSNYYNNWKDSIFIQATIQNIGADKYQNLQLPIPSILEQTTIANFLDHKTQLIDDLIAKKERLIKLLQEERTAIINQAVTKGLDPNLPMKDSGIEWLGEIPEHWEVKKIKHIKSLCRNSFVDGPFGSNLKSMHYVTDGEVYVIESGFITSGSFITRKFKTISKDHFETIKRSESKGGDIIISKIGANFGMSGILPFLDKQSVVSGNSLKLTVNDELYSNEYIHYTLLINKWGGTFDLIVNSTAQPALSLTALNEIKIGVPKIIEQKKIVEFIQIETKRIDRIIDLARNEIFLLKEYDNARMYIPFWAG